MEHIPQPAKPFRPIRTPFRNGPPYDNLGFSGFPARVGWDIGKVVNRGRNGAYDQDGAPGLLQEWLWFGMLTECLGACGVRVRREDFLREEMGGDGERAMVFVTTAKLYAYSEKFEDAASQCSEVAQLEALKKIYVCLTEVSEYLEANEFLEGRAESFRDEGILENPLTPDIRLSVEALRISLSYFAISSLPKFFALDIPDVGCRFLVDRAVDLGMCPRMALGIQRNYGSLALYYAALLGLQPGMGERHEECQRGNCTASDIKDGDIYHQSHTLGCELEDCGEFEPNQELVGMIIDAGGIPLVYLEWSDTGDVYDAGVCRYESGQNFTAISHVWSDGLGSPYKNAIPICKAIQLSGLSGLIPHSTQSAERKQYLWLDTLCVPVQSSIRRNAAIKTIPTIYRAATQVLVLDSFLIRQPVPPTTVEILMRVLLSKWHHRLWTFQEGVLAVDRLWILFADSSIRFISLVQELLYPTSKTNFEYDNQIHAAAIDVCLSYVSAFLDRSTSLDDLDWVVEGARTRSTSKSSDETLCLASLLSLDVAAVVEAPSNRRMQTLLLVKKKVSKKIIFLIGSKLPDPGFRWAPASFLVDWSKAEVNLLRAQEPEDFASVTKSGLLGSFRGLRLERTEKRIWDPLWIHVTALNQLYYIRFDIAEENLRDMLPSRGLGIILNRPIEGSGAPSIATAALLAECEQGEGGVVAGRYVCYVSLEPLEMEEGSASRRSAFLRQAWEAHQVGVYQVDDDIYATYTTAELTHPDQQWLIS